MAKITRKPAKKSVPAKAAKQTKVAKKSAPKKEAAPRANGVDREAKINVLVDENPKRGAAAERFALYAKAKTVGDYVAAGGTLADIRWDTKKGFISLG